jgi:hypothetical protein
MCKKLSILFISFVYSFSLHATHIQGAEIWFDYINGTNYKIHVALYGSGGPGVLYLPTSVTLDVIGHNTLTDITLSRDTLFTLHNCSMDAKNAYYSTTVNLGSLPPNGITLNYQECCRPSGINNITNSAARSLNVTTVMIPISGTATAPSSPRRLGTPYILGSAAEPNVLNSLFATANPADSMYVELYNIRDDSVNNILYYQGYTAQQPFGAFANAVLDNYTGILTLDSVGVGGFAVGFKVSSYRNGQLTCIIERDVSYFFSAPAEIPPSVNVTDLNSTAILNHGVNTLFVEMNPGDILDLLFVASDSTGNTVRLFGEGDLFANSPGTSGNCLGNSCASFTPVGSSFLGQSSVSAVLSFQPDTSLFSSGINRVQSTLLIQGLTPACLGEIATPYAINITVNRPGSTWGPSQLAICNGDSVRAQLFGDTSNIVWSPTTGVSNPNSASPWLSPQTSMQYTVTNLNDGTQIQLA